VSTAPDVQLPLLSQPDSTRDSLLSHPTFAPYTDDPEQGTASPEPATVLQVQRLLMDGGQSLGLVSVLQKFENSFTEQDLRLDELSHSINRQHHISVQINDELDVHQGLLQEFDADLDRTDSRLRKARRKLDTLARGVKENGYCTFITSRTAKY